MRISPALAGKIAENATRGIEVLSNQSSNQLSNTAVVGAQSEIKQEVQNAIVQAGTGDGVAVVQTKSAFLSKINWTQAIALLAAGLTFFGIDLDAPTQAAILTGIVAISSVITWALKTFFSNTVTASSMK